MKITVKQILLYVQIFCTIVIIFIMLFVPVDVRYGHKEAFWGSPVPSYCGNNSDCTKEFFHPQFELFPVILLLLSWGIYATIASATKPTSLAWKFSVAFFFLLDLAVMWFVVFFLLFADEGVSQTSLGGLLYSLLNFMMFIVNLIAVLTSKESD